ncbi:MAG: diacylglycerol kinase family lipid kinase [Anaerolineales bacterium]
MRKVFVVQNPVSGTQSSEKITQLVKTYLSDKGWSFDIHLTEENEDVASVVSKAAADGFNIFLAVGGDGTVSMVATGLKDTQLPLAIIPAGTGNGMARDLKIPLSLEKAISLLDHPNNVRLLDAMEVNGHHYLLNLSVGLTPKALKESKREEKQKLGRLAYFLSGLKAFVGIQPVNFVLEIDGEKHYTSASEVILMNSVTLGDPGRFLSLDINVDDGVLDLFVIEAKTALDYLRVFWYLIMRKPNHDPDVERYEVRKSLVIEGHKLLEVQADGELIGYTPVRVTLAPQSVRMIVPPEEKPKLRLPSVRGVKF